VPGCSTSASNSPSPNDPTSPVAPPPAGGSSISSTRPLASVSLSACLCAPISCNSSSKASNSAAACGFAAAPPSALSITSAAVITGGIACLSTCSNGGSGSNSGASIS
jgi:hypothetical protein